MTSAARDIPRHAPARGDEANFDLHIILGYAAAAILMLCLIYAASSGPGTSANDLAAMSAFP
jgi:hypothetical protein